MKISPKDKSATQDENTILEENNNEEKLDEESIPTKKKSRVNSGFDVVDLTSIFQSAETKRLQELQAIQIEISIKKSNLELRKCEMELAQMEGNLKLQEMEFEANSKLKQTEAEIELARLQLKLIENQNSLGVKL